MQFRKESSVSKKTYKVPKEVGQLFLKNSVCRAACKEVVHQAIQHYELAMLEADSLWKGIADKLNLDLENFHYEHDERASVITQTRPRIQDPEMAKTVQHMTDRIAVMKAARDSINEASWK